MKAMKKKLKLSSTFKTCSEKETFALARKFAAGLSGGEIIILEGPIGAGKTVFASGLAAGLGCKKRPVSSTFNLMRIYEGRLKMAHFDLFRLKSGRELDFEFEDYFSEEYVAVIEWPKAAEKVYSRFSYFRVEIELSGGDEREIKIYEY